MFELITLELLYCQSMPSKKKGMTGRPNGPTLRSADQVMLFGQSAGAGSVSCHLAMPLSNGLYSGALMESGGFAGWSAQNMQHKEWGWSQPMGEGFFFRWVFHSFSLLGRFDGGILIFRVYRHWSCIFGPLNSHFGWFCAFVLRPQLKLWISMKNWLVCRDQLRLFIL